MPSHNLLVPEQLYNIGQYSGEWRNIPAVYDGYKITLTRVNWPEGIVAKLYVDLSLNNRGTWLPFDGPNDLVGGTLIDRYGQLQTVQWFSSTWPGENDGTGKRRVLGGTDLRWRLDVLIPFTTAITMEGIKN